MHKRKTNNLTSADEQTLVLLDSTLHLVQLPNVVLDVRNPMHPVALPARDPHSLGLQHPLLYLVRDHNHAVRNAVDPAESLVREAQEHALHAVCRLYRDAPTILAVAGDETTGAQIGCAGAQGVRDVEDGVDGGLFELRGQGWC